ncbi:MAG TPA: phenylacetate--CoA ligase [Gemmatimonadales bacterium]
MPIWNAELETCSRAELTALQVERLRRLVGYLQERVPFYHERLTRAGVSPDAIRSLDDLRRLPFTGKVDLRDQYPFGLLAVPRERVARIHASSGTTGNPTVGAYTSEDLALWGEVMARSLSMAGVTERDTVHNAYGYGLFTGGLGVHVGAERIGATVVPVSGGLTRRQVKLLEDFGATVLTCTPSYALAIADEIAEQALDVRARLKLRVGVFGAEPWTERMRTEIEHRLHLEALNIYGLTEIIGPGVAQECEAKRGMHLFEDVFLPEIVDPETGEQLPLGEVGELVLTTLTKEAMPLLRYRTRDRTRLLPECCDCGRTQVRMDRVLGRTDDMLVIKGVNVFPQLIERTLLAIPHLGPHYQIIIDRPRGTVDAVEIRVEMAADMLEPVEPARLEDLRRRVEHELAQALGVSIRVKLVGPREIPRSEGKAKRVIDRRELV